MFDAKCQIVTSQRLTSPKWVKWSFQFQSQTYIIWKCFRRGIKPRKPFLATTRTTRVIRLQRNLISPPEPYFSFIFFHSFWQNKLIFRWHIPFIVVQNRIILDFCFLTQKRQFKQTKKLITWHFMTSQNRFPGFCAVTNFFFQIFLFPLAFESKDVLWNLPSKGDSTLKLWN